METRYRCRDKECYEEYGCWDKDDVEIKRTFPGTLYEPPEYTGYCPVCNQEADAVDSCHCEYCELWFDKNDMQDKVDYWVCQWCDEANQ